MEYNTSLPERDRGTLEGCRLSLRDGAAVSDAERRLNICASATFRNKQKSERINPSVGVSERGVMQSRLTLCSQVLNEVEEELVELQASSDDPEEGFAITESLSFVDQAKHAISQAQTRVKELS